jgi:large subunit ribosomal protein L29
MSKHADTFKGKSADELNAQVAELKKELFNLRFQKASGELTNTSRFKAVRREIAQIMTHINASSAA